jgi:pimeloyl-[acyl-carrier protein] synthase
MLRRLLRLEGPAGNLVRGAGIRWLLLRERLETGVTFNPLSTSLLENPYPGYRALRSQDPVHYSRLARGWVLTRYEDVATVLRDPRFSVERSRAFDGPEGSEPADGFGIFFETLSRTILFEDPPDHTRLRALVSKAFTPRAVEALRPRVEELVEGLLNDARERGRMDAIPDLAIPLPVLVIAEMLGVPPEDRALFKRWSGDVAAGLEPVFDKAVIRRANQTTSEIIEYFRTIIHKRRAEPGEDLVSRLVAAEEAGDRLDETEMLAFCLLLLVAGNETTTNLIGNGLLALMRHPDQLRRLRDDPALTESAVEELLRYDSPVQLTGRVALEDLEIGGKRIAKNQFIIPMTGAANHDPAQFPDPDRLDIGRRDNRHLAFGLGIHFCLGAPLARAEGQIAFRALVERLPKVMLNGPPRWRRTMTLRGLQSLPLAC